MSKDWTTEERKLGPVYDDIQSKRYKVADGQVTKWLKKHPKSQPALVLRMVLNQKLGQGAPAVLRAYEEVRKTGELTGRSVWWIISALRGISRPDLLLGLLQELWAARPDSLDFGQQVFLQAASVNDSDTMMQSSRKMFNLTKSSVWARAAAYSQWNHAAPQPTTSTPFPPPAPPRSLIISQTLLRTSKAPETPDHLWLHLQILLSSGQLSDALGLARKEGGYGTLTRTWVRMRAVEEIAQRMEEDVGQVWKVERDWVVGLLKGNGDEWRNYTFYQYLLAATEKLVPSDSAVASSTRDVLRTMDEKIGTKERSPALAILELDMRIRKLGHHDLALGEESWKEAVGVYWKKWGSKGCSVTEIEGVLGDDANRMRFVLEMLKEVTNGGHTDLNSYLALVHAELFILRQHKVMWNPTKDEASRLWKLYQEGLQYGLNLPKTDVQPADEIGYAAVQLLLIRTIWHSDRTPDSSLFQAIACLEDIITKSPSAAHARFLLVRLYRLIGTPSLIEAHLVALKPAEIQLDNLLHVLFERGSGEAILGGLGKYWDTQYEAAVKMYDRTASDLPEYIKAAMENESYSKIHGIRDLDNSVSRSLSAQVASIENAKLSLLSSKPLPQEGETRLSSSLSDITSLVDTRNYELLPEIGGQRVSVREITPVPVVGVNEEWVRVMGGLLILLGRFSRGETIEVKELELGSLDVLSPAERINVSLSIRILGRTIRAIEEPESQYEEESFSSDVDDLVKLCTSINSLGAWGSIHAHLNLIELSRILDLVLARLREASAPKKGKKASPALVGQTNSLKALKEDLEGRMRSLVYDVDSLVDISWSKTNLLEDEFVESIRTRIVSSRKLTISNLSKLLEGKKI